MATRIPGTVITEELIENASAETTSAHPVAKSNSVAVPTAVDRAGNDSAATTSADETPVAQVRGLIRDFDGRRVLDGLDLDIAPGEFVALLGRSGSGKSTLLRALAGLDRGVQGELTTHGTIAVAFQEPRLVPWKRVLANVFLGLRHSDPKAAARAALAEVGLSERANAWPLTLSGGEAQRASLARALVREPDLLLLDEPFSALDALTRITIHRLVIDLWQRRKPGVLLVTHDVDEALRLADRVLVLGDGRIAHESRIDLPRPRRGDHPHLLSLRETLLAELGVAPEGTE
ncbi:ABC transporter ATP-binding protein [Nocardia sp. NPDC046473]|uniref:ABC transporter ATP-binding protein n=1 Tax=Nocardia sp. NPDC046473 TaxID=3155733 RepID=UPI0033FB8BF4